MFFRQKVPKTVKNEKVLIFVVFARMTASQADFVPQAHSTIVNVILCKEYDKTLNFELKNV